MDSLEKSVSVNRSGYSTLSKCAAIIQAEFMYGGYLTALGTVLILFCVWALMEKPISWPVLLIGYLISLLVYGFNYFMELEGDAASNPERAAIVGKKASIYPVALCLEAVLLAALLLASGNMGMALFCFIIVFAGMMYTAAFKGLTRFIPAFKSVYTSFIWAAIALVPLFQYSLGLDPFFILAFAFIFLKSLINVIFFDIKDIGPDGAQGLKTVPVLLGKERTIRSLKVMNFLAFVPVIAGVWLGAMPVFSLSLLPLLAYTHYYLDKGGRSDEKGVRYISYALAESEAILWVILLVIGKAIFPIF